jgi:hypothetical protein
VVEATQAIILYSPIAQRNATVRAMLSEEPWFARCVTVKHEVFAQNLEG